MPATVTVNMPLTYGQVLGLAMQLPDKEQHSLCRDLSSKWRTFELRSIRDSIDVCTLSDEEIRQECEIVRQQMYDKFHA